MAAYDDDLQRRPRGPGEPSPGPVQGPEPGKSTLTSSLGGPSAPIAGEPSPSTLAPPPSVSSDSDVHRGHSNALTAASSDEFIVDSNEPSAPGATKAPRDVPRSGSAATAAPNPPAPSMPALGANDGVDIVSSLDTREQSVRALFSQSRASMRMVIAGQAAAARGDANHTADNIEAQGAAFSSALLHAAHEQGSRITNKAKTSGHIIHASAAALLAQIATTSRTAFAAIPDANDDERGAVNGSISDTRDQLQHKVTENAARNAHQIEIDARRGASSYVEAAAILWSKAEIELQQAAVATRETGNAVATHIEQLAEANSAALDEAEREMLDAIARARRGAIASLSSRPGQDGPTAEMTARERHGLGLIDGLIHTVGGSLVQATAGFGDDCAKRRAEARGAYAAAESAILTKITPQIGTAAAGWRESADQFIAGADRFLGDIAAAHTQLSGEVASQFRQIAVDALAETRRSWVRDVGHAVKTGFERFGAGLLQFAAAVLIAAVFVLVDLAGTPIWAALGIAALGVGLGLLTIALYRSLQARFAEASAATKDLPWYSQLYGSLRAGVAGVGDAFMVTPIVEGGFGRDFVTNRPLSTEERAERITEGTLGLATGAVTHAALTRGPGAVAVPETVEPTGGQLPGREPLQLPAGEAPKPEPLAEPKPMPVVEPKKGARPAPTESNDEGSTAAHHGEQAPKGKDAPESSTGQDPAQAVKASTNRVTEPRPGLYENLDVDKDPPGWAFYDSHIKYEGNKRVIETTVYGPGKKSGSCIRAYDPTTNKLEMREAFLEELPSWINDGGTQLVEGTGTPLVAYITMRQMKFLGVEYGRLEKVKMSSIQNLRAIIELHVLRSEGVDPNVAVMRTHSLAYGETPLIQSGHKIVRAKVGGNMWIQPLDTLMKFRETRRNRGSRDMGLVAEHDKLIAEYGRGLVDRDTPVWMNYDIDLDVAPFSGGE